MVTKNLPSGINKIKKRIAKKIGPKFGLLKNLKSYKNRQDKRIVKTCITGQIILFR
jgi:hypothetical protein